MADRPNTTPDGAQERERESMPGTQAEAKEEKTSGRAGEDENGAGAGGPAEKRGNADGKSKNGKRVLPFLLTALAAAVLSALVTLLICHRFLYLDTKQSYERKLAQLSEELSPKEDKQAFKDLPDKFSAVYGRFIDSFPGNTDGDLLSAKVFAAFASACGDRYARICTAEEYAALSSSSSQDAGIGVTVSRTPDDRAVITYLEKNGPASLAGVLPYDEIVAVDGTRLADAGYDEGLSLIKGKENSTVTLTVRREGETLNIAVQRKRVTYSTVHARFLENGACGYIELLSFGSATPTELENALKEILDAGAEKLIFDLRGNRGSSSQNLLKVLDLVLSDKDEKGDARVLFFTKDAKDNVSRYACGDGKQIPALPCAVLIDGTAAKDAEIFAYVLKAELGAKIVGTPSAGDVSQQSWYKLKDGTMLYFTSAFCFPADGTVLTDVGVQPDLTVKNGAGNRYLLSPEEEPLFAAALELLSEA